MGPCGDPPTDQDFSPPWQPIGPLLPPFEADEAVSIGTLALLQQPDIHRGQTIVAKGQLVRIERIELADPRSEKLGLTQQWNCWLRPDDGTDQPWLTVVADLPSVLGGLVQEGSITDIRPPFPTIVVTGQYLKRLSYQSASGVELTPVVVGYVSSVQSNGNAALRTVENPQSAGVQPNDEPPIALILIGTVLAGIGLAGGLMFYSIRQHRHLRDRRKDRNVQLPE